jgi:hypothetical protein
MSLSPIEQGDALVGVSAASAGVAWLAVLQFAQVGLAIIAAGIAIVAGLYAIRVHRKNLKK